jgi:Fur family transcriptional regulator, peroxide stress response regulator
MEKIISKYRGKGFKLTPQRIAILKYLENNTEHPTAEDIYNEIRKKHPTVSFATVYNTIQALKDRGELTEVTIDPERKHFDPNPRPHHHIICTVCNRIGDIFMDFSAVLHLPEEILADYALTGNHIDFYGICRDCRTSKERMFPQ